LLRFAITFFVLKQFRANLAMTKTQWVELGIYPVMNCNDKDSDDW